MKKSFIITNAIAFIIFIIVLFISFEGVGADIYTYNSNMDFTGLLLKIFSLSGIIIQFYFINKKLSE